VYKNVKRVFGLQIARKELRATTVTGVSIMTVSRIQ